MATIATEVAERSASRHNDNLDVVTQPAPPRTRYLSDAHIKVAKETESMDMGQRTRATRKGQDGVLKGL